MENGWDLFNYSGCGGDRRGQNGNCSNNNHHAWGLWELGSNASSGVDNYFSQDIAAAATTMHRRESEMHALMSSSHHQGTNSNVYDQSAGLSSCSSPSSSTHFAGGVGGGGGGGLCYFPDPHLTSLKLGKRHYFENATNPTVDHEPPPPQTASTFAGITTKRGKQPAYYEQHGGFSGGPSTSVTVPRCQVEGCSVVLVNGKEYHRRHKVCEVHSKASKVVFLGVEQRFCQQCSRFHVLSEFDDSKRSCRRRLAGHNERRRKSSQDHSAPRNLIQDDRLMGSKYPPYLPLNSGSSALSLLSSKHNPLWMSSHDLSARCSEALRELIAENRASSILPRQLIVDRNSRWRPHPPTIDPNHQQLHNRSNSFERGCPQPSWENGNAGTHLTLDLKQTPSAAFGYLSVQRKSKEEECSEFWGAFKGTRVL